MKKQLFKKNKINYRHASRFAVTASLLLIVGMLAAQPLYALEEDTEPADAQTFKLRKDERGFTFGADQYQRYEFGKALAERQVP